MKKLKIIFSIFVLAIAMSFLLFIPIISKADSPSRSDYTSILKTNVFRTKPVADVKSSDVSLEERKEQPSVDFPLTCSEGYMESSESGEFEGKIDFYCITYTQGCQDINNNDPNIIGTKDSNGKINCNCISGYVWNGNNCITHTENCIQAFGTNVYGTKGDNNNSSCSCESGYEWNLSGTACVKKIESMGGKQQNIKRLQEQIISIISQIIMLQKQLLLLLNN